MELKLGFVRRTYQIREEKGDTNGNDAVGTS